MKCWYSAAAFFDQESFVMFMNTSLPSAKSLLHTSGNASSKHIGVEKVTKASGLGSGFLMYLLAFSLSAVPSDESSMSAELSMLYSSGASVPRTESFTRGILNVTDCFPGDMDEGILTTVFMNQLMSGLSASGISSAKGTRCIFE